jgi:hypothetical protein
MTMRVTILEGTPEEILAAMPHLQNPDYSSGAVVPAAPAPAEPGDEGEGGLRYVSTAVARRALTRAPLSDKPKAVLVQLYNAHPETLLARELQTHVDYTASQFAGLMGAFGRRVVNTPGYGDGEAFFMQNWDYDAGCMRYGLPESVREAMRLENIV